MLATGSWPELFRFSRATVRFMENIATINFRDLNSGDEAVAIVRAGSDRVALALTLRTGGDLEVVVPADVSAELAAALSEAGRVSGQA